VGEKFIGAVEVEARILGAGDKTLGDGLSDD
jgi:hypothetical protein